MRRESRRLCCATMAALLDVFVLHPVVGRRRGAQSASFVLIGLWKGAVVSHIKSVPLPFYSVRRVTTHCRKDRSAYNGRIVNLDIPYSPGTRPSVDIFVNLDFGFPPEANAKVDKLSTRRTHVLREFVSFSSQAIDKN